MTRHDEHRTGGADAPPPALAQALGRLREDLEHQSTPPALWPRVAASVAAAPARVPVVQPSTAQGPSIAAGTPRWSTWLGLGAAVLAALCLVWAAGPGRVARPAKSGAPLAPPVVSTMHASGFVPVASPERFAELWQGDAQAAPAWVVPTELPRERLAALGLPYDPARAGELVHAELLLHPSGDVLAVRLTR